jgi:hypothetical protein
MMMTALWLWGTSCTESPIGQTPVDDVPPPPVTNVRVGTTPGGAIIRYDLPNVTDILYVKGEYWFQGAYKVTRASAMNNRMEIDGLGSVAPVEVTLYVVDHSENVSTPERVAFNPDMPPVESIFRSLEVVPAFGGIQIQWDNPTGAEIGFTVFVADSTDTFDDGTIFFSTAKEGLYTFRNVPDFSERRFGISLLDKWGNTTPVKEWILTPKFEEKISTAHITQQYSLPWDNTSEQNGQRFTFLFDGTKIATGFNSWHTKENEPLNVYGFTSPVMFSIDLNAEVILGRIILWQGRYDDAYFLYGHHNPRTFEVWGTKTPDLTQPMEYWKDEWKADWTKLADCKIVKPSDPGLTVGNRDYTTEDFTVANAGHEFYMPLTPVRYLRFVVTSSWTSDKDNVTTLQEIEFWGDDGIDN